MDRIARGEVEREGSNVNVGFGPERGLTRTERRILAYLGERGFATVGELVVHGLGYSSASDPYLDSRSVRAHMSNIRQKTGLELRSVRALRGYVLDGREEAIPWCLRVPPEPRRKGCPQCGAEHVRSSAYCSRACAYHATLGWRVEPAAAAS
jgi:hypothetical protein